MKKIKAFLFTLLFGVVGICIACVDGNVVRAAETVYVDSTGAFISEYTTISKAGQAPTATTEGYEEWLFAGWYKDQECTKGNVIKKASINSYVGQAAYAKFVSADLLTVKIQVSENTQGSSSTNMRMVSSVDTLNYAGVGLTVEYHRDDGTTSTQTFAGNKVFNEIIASAESGVDYDYNAKVFDTESSWFITATITDITSDNYDNNFVIKPYWVTFDGTYVYGESRYVQIQDAYSNVVPVSIKADSQEAVDAFSISGKKITERRYYAGQKYATLLVEESRNTLPSLTSYTVQSSGTTVRKATYRNLESAIGTVTDTIPAGDKTWYETISNENEFVIINMADLYGFAELVNAGTQQFQYKTIYLGANITVNEENSSTYGWNPIGTFYGTFDGYGSTISGIHAEKDSNYVGFFSVIAQGSTIKNFKLVDSYFEGISIVGGVVGRLLGDVESVYCSATVVSTGGLAGGIVGQSMASENPPQELHIKDCWFDGQLEVTLVDGPSYAGGILGDNRNNHVTISHCLNSGNITTASNRYSPMVGGINGCTGIFSNEVATTSIDDCLNVGNISAPNSQAMNLVASIIGYSLNTNTQVTNTYASTESHAKATTYVAEQRTISGQWPEKQMIGYGGYQWTTLDFENYWTVVEDGTPILKSFAESVPSIAGIERKIDVSWYDESQDTYSIDSAAKLVGFNMLARSNDFSGKIVQLEKSITFNAGLDITKSEKVEFIWSPIGTADVPFKGTFDGKEKIISGVCAESNAQYLGLFGVLNEIGVIKNVRLKNSYFNQTGFGFVGSIVCDSSGQVSNVYSDADIITQYKNAGGIVGRSYGSSTITNCWYNGTIKMKDNATYGGGILSAVLDGSCTMTNCLFTGEIFSDYPNTKAYVFVGGMCGGIESPVTSLNLSACVSTGTIETSNMDFGAGAFVGRVKGGTTLTMENVFASRDAGYTEIGAPGYGTVSGQAVWTTSSDRLIGYCKEDSVSGAYTGAKLTFSSVWILRDKGVPVPATFDDLVTKVSKSNISEAIGLDTWSANLASAIHNGAGKYVLQFENSNTTYRTYVNKLKNTLGFTEHAVQSSDMKTDGVFNTIYTNPEGDWVLNVFHSDNDQKTTITVRTGVKEILSPNLLSSNVTRDGEEDITLSMLSLTGTDARDEAGEIIYYAGNCFVFQLPNKHFIINDGGNSGDLNGLLEYLKVMAGKDAKGKQNPVYIDAWTVTHQHGDHFGVMKGFYANPDAINDITVEAFYVNEPNNRAFDFLEADGSYIKESGEAKLQYRGMTAMRTADGKQTPIYSYQTGERYYFNGLTMDVIQSQELIPVSDYGALNRYHFDKNNDFNTTSTVLLFTTEDGQKTLIGGDANHKNMDYITQTYGTNPATLNSIDVLQSWHHGKNMSHEIKYDNSGWSQYVATDAQVNTFLNYLTNNATNKFSVVLYPCSKVHGVDANTEYGAFPYAVVANNYTINQCIAAGGAYYTFDNDASDVAIDTSYVVRVTFKSTGIEHGRYLINALLPEPDIDDETGNITPGNPNQNIPGLWN